MHNYKHNFDDNCHELTVLRWFRDNHMTLLDKLYYYKVAPNILKNISQSKNKSKYYQYIYEKVVKVSVEAIERGDYSFAYNRYKKSVQVLENHFTELRKKHTNVNIIENESSNENLI